MSDPPRRRRSPAPPRRPSSSSSSWLPTIALGIGVVVAGLGIGAFLSAMQHKETQTTASTRATPVRGLPPLTPVAHATRGPVAIATLVAHPTASPTPTATASPTPTARPTGTATPRATPRATASPRPSATPAAAETATPRATATPHEPAVTPTPIVITPRPATPRPTSTPVAEAVATPIPRPTPLTFSGIAQNTVRRYLSDLIAGNENGAYAELGKSPGDAGALSEEAFIDRGTRITSVRTTSSDPTGATIEVRLSSSRGEYYATYHVTNGPSGPIIDQHDYIKE
jgi:hypothetical protein